MKERQKTGKGWFKSLIDFPRWMGWSQIKRSAKDIKSLARTVMTPEEAKHHESFEEAVHRLSLNEKDIQNQIKKHFRLFILFLSITIVLISYAIYLLTTRHYAGFLLGIFSGILASSFAFREHFYYFQMKTRQLGSTFQDWTDFVLGRTKK